MNSRAIGVIVTLIYLFWLFYHLQLAYSVYFYPDILRPYWVPNWMVFLNAVVGLLGVYTGVRIFKQSITIKRGLVLSFGILFLALGIEICRNL